MKLAKSSAKLIGTKQRVFITGGASGLGRSLALQFAAQGSSVCIGDVDESRGREVLSELIKLGVPAHFAICNVTKDSDFEQVRNWLEQNWNGVDVVINNAGVVVGGSTEDTSLTDWQWIVDINLLGVVRGCKAFIPLFKRQGHGHFVNIASMAGLVHPPLMGAYNATKAGVVALSETLSFELALTNMAVSVVCPTFFRTRLAENMRSADSQSKDLGEKLVTRAKKDSGEIAEQIVKEIRKRKFLILTDWDGRAGFSLKRALPSFLYRPLGSMLFKHYFEK